MTVSGQWYHLSSYVEAFDWGLATVDKPLRNAHNTTFLLAIRNLPASMTNDYFVALKHCPDIVMSETHPIKFIRCEHGNSW